LMAGLACDLPPAAAKDAEGSGEVVHVPREWRNALRKLAFMARSSGGTPGPDTGLMQACSEAETLLSRPYLHTTPPASQPQADHLPDDAKMVAQAAWQPIETAPRGSGENGPGNVDDPDYVEPPILLLCTPEGQRVGYYDWYYHPGYGRGADPHESPWRCAEGGQAYKPTHWMPLPPPPSINGLEVKP
jgi:hypothetical protein